MKGTRKDIKKKTVINKIMDKRLIVAIVFTIVVTSHSAKILAVFPTPSISHHVVFRPLIEELIKRGNEVVVITTNPAYPQGEAPVNLTEIDIGNVSYTIWKKEFVDSDVGKCNNLYNQFKRFIKTFTAMFENQMRIESIKNIIKNKDIHFDLLLLETCMRPALAFSYVFKAPVISISSFGPTLGTYSFLGVPNHPLLYPTFSNQRLYNLTVWEKIKELVYNYLIYLSWNSNENEQNKMLKKYFGPDISPFSELYNNIDMFFQNVKPLVMDNPPVPSSAIYIGGIHQKAPKPLTKDVLSYLNRSKSGVIYVSFGTNIKSSNLSSQKIDMMIRVFSKLPYDVLWKMDNKKFSGVSKNIKISEWLPQADLLKHKNMKAFITQGGQQSTDEALEAGVPLIAIPMFADQWFNAEKYVHHKIGVKLDWISLTEEELRGAILNVTEDKSYRENIRKFYTIVNDQPLSPLEYSMLWIEHVLRHGGAKHLRAPAANMSWTEYYELDLVIIVIFSVIVAVFCLFLFFEAMWYNIFKFLKYLS